MTNNIDSIRINKRLVELGLAESRRKADEFILSGSVSINGKPASIGDTVNIQDKIKLNSKSGVTRDDITILFNKPKGYICSHTKQGESPTIFSILPKNFVSLKIAGRLDKDSQGLVILSSNGNLINNLLHPSSNKLKTYIVNINSRLNQKDKARLAGGVKLTDGLSVFINLKLMTPQQLKFSLSEGRNRQIRRSLSQLGYKVTKLERISLGEYSLGTITSGKYQFVNAKSKK